MITSGFWGLLAAARSGDEAAFGALWRATNPGLMRYLQVVTPARADAVSVSTWSSVIRALSRFRGDEADWRMFVFATARRCARRRPAGEFRHLRRPASDAYRLPDAITDTALRMLAALPVPEGEVLVLRTACALSVAETAQVLQLTPASVRATAHRGLARAGVLVSSPDLRRRVDDGRSPAEPADWVALAALPDPRVAETVFDRLLAGGAVPAGAPRRWRELGEIIAALTALATPGELAGYEAAVALFRKGFVTGARHARKPVRLGSRVAVAVTAASILLPGALTAAYAGVLPDWLQTVAHEWFDAPVPAPHEHPPVPANDSVPPGEPARPSRRTARPGPTSVAHPKTPGSTRGSPSPTSIPSGSTKTPPGSTKTPPSSATRTPPGSAKTPPGSTRTPPSSAKTPPGSTRTPPAGASGDPATRR